MIHYVELMAMLSAAVASHVNGRDVVVTLIGGTLLSIALTRPRLQWVEQLTEDSEKHRLYAQRAFTWLSFMMGGYAGFSVFLVLYHQVNSEVDSLLDGAAAFLCLYAAIVHFEPFVNEWRLGDGTLAVCLYAVLAGSASMVGTWVAAVVLEPQLSWSLNGSVLGACLICLVLWRLLYPRSRARQAARPTRTPARPTKASRPADHRSRGRGSGRRASRGRP